MLQLTTQCLALVSSIYIYISKGLVGVQLTTQCLALVSSIYIYISKGLADAAAHHTMPCISF